MQRFYKALFPTFVLLLMALPMSANDCITASTIGVGSPAMLAFDGFPNGPSPSFFPLAFGDAWFEWVPGGAAGTVYDMNFQITPNGNCQVNILFLYSELFEAGYTACNTLTNHFSLPNQTLTGGITYNYQPTGVDATGHFFVVIEYISGPGTQVTVEPIIQLTNAVPANDDCNNATILTAGSGIEPNLNLGPTAGTWVNGADISTVNATKKRLQSGCNTGNTQDHYVHSAFLLGCVENGNLGDNALPSLLGFTQCKLALMNTTFYKFVAPVSAADFVISLGSATQCTQEPNRIVAMIYDEAAGFSCGDAKSSVSSGSLMACQAFNVTGTLPTPDFEFTGLTLNAGQTYWIVVDGDRGAQCELKVLVSRGTNPILPVTLSYFEGEHVNGTNVLRWETSTEEQHDRFDIERSINGGPFNGIGSIKSQGNSTTPASYQYTDTRSPIGSSRYRLKMVDMNGHATYSETVELTRFVESLTVLGIVPNPATDFTELVLSSPQSVSATITIRDLQGKILNRDQISRESGEHRIPLNLESYPSGLYLINVSSASYSYTDKLVVR